MTREATTMTADDVTYLRSRIVINRDGPEDGESRS
jgi:hypothetical protein